MVNTVDHLRRRYIRQKPKAASVNAQDRRARVSGQATGIQDRSVATDCDDEVGVTGRVIREQFNSCFSQMIGQDLHWLGDMRVVASGHNGDALK